MSEMSTITRKVSTCPGCGIGIYAHVDAEVTASKPSFNSEGRPAATATVRIKGVRVAHVCNGIIPKLDDDFEAAMASMTTQQKQTFEELLAKRNKLSEVLAEFAAKPYEVVDHGQCPDTCLIQGMYGPIKTRKAEGDE